MLQSESKGVNYRHPLHSQYDQDSCQGREDISEKAIIDVGLSAHKLQGLLVYVDIRLHVFYRA
jgi:hypothetical protein